MKSSYLPPSKLLRAIISNGTPLAGSKQADTARHQVLEMMQDKHPANRDWATLLLAQEEYDDFEVREALLLAAKDSDQFVRAEAIRGLAKRDKALALPLTQRELAGQFASVPILEAAAILADASLVKDLRAFAEPSGDPLLDELALEALSACEGKPELR